MIFKNIFWCTFTFLIWGKVCYILPSLNPHWYNSCNFEEHFLVYFVPPSSSEIGFPVVAYLESSLIETCVILTSKLQRQGFRTQAFYLHLRIILFLNKNEQHVLIWILVATHKVGTILLHNLVFWHMSPFLVVSDWYPDIKREIRLSLHVTESSKLQSSQFSSCPHMSLLFPFHLRRAWSTLSVAFYSVTLPISFLCDVFLGLQGIRRSQAPFPIKRLFSVHMHSILVFRSALSASPRILESTQNTCSPLPYFDEAWCKTEYASKVDISRPCVLQPNLEYKDYLHTSEAILNQSHYSVPCLASCFILLDLA